MMLVVDIKPETNSLVMHLMHIFPTQVQDSLILNVLANITLLFPTSRDKACLCLR